MKCCSINGIRNRFRFTIKWHKQNTSFLFHISLQSNCGLLPIQRGPGDKMDGREADHSPIFKMLMMSIPPNPYSFYVLLCHEQEQFYLYLYLVKVKWSRYRPGVAQRVGRGIALLFHDGGTRRGWGVSSTPRPHFTLYPSYRGLGGPQGRSGRVENLVPTGIRSQIVQPVAQSLYRLSYPAQAFTLYLGFILEVQFSKFDQETVNAIGLTPSSSQASWGPPVYLLFYESSHWPYSQYRVRVENFF